MVIKNLNISFASKNYSLKFLDLVFLKSKFLYVCVKNEKIEQSAVMRLKLYCL